jgi:hypothetical protein
MPKFTDADGREWSLALTIGDIRRVRQEVNVDLAEVGQSLFESLSDPVKLVDVLHALLVEECKARGIDAVAFARGMRGDTLDDASRQLLEAIVDFFPSRRRPLLEKLRDKSETLAEKVMNRQLALLDSDRLDRAVEADLDRLERALEKRSLSDPAPSGAPFMSGLDSSDSIPPY